MDIYKQLKEKFANNFDASIGVDKEKLIEAELKASVIYNFGALMNKNVSSETIKSINGIYDEIFSDLSISIYLSLCSIDNASRVLLRRALELGIATLYFRDMPHRFWHWRETSTHDADLSFRENTDFLSSDAYKSYLLNEHKITWVIDKEKINKLYRELSNIIHGKYDTFETTAATSFDYNEGDFKENLSKVIRCENILISCLCQRFPEIFKKIKQDFPSLSRYNNVY